MKNLSLLDGLTIPCGNCGNELLVNTTDTSNVVICPKCQTKNRIEFDSSIDEVRLAEEKLNKLFD